MPSKVEPFDGEEVRYSRPASRAQHARRAVGGRLYVTNRRVLFCPHAVDAALAGEYWWVEHSAIRGLGRAERNYRALHAGGLRRRLRIELVGGDVELFVINKLDQVIAEIRAAA